MSKPNRAATRRRSFASHGGRKPRRGGQLYARLLATPANVTRRALTISIGGGVILSVLDPTAGGVTPTPGPKSLYFASTNLDAVHGRARALARWPRIRCTAVRR